MTNRKEVKRMLLEELKEAEQRLEFTQNEVKSLRDAWAALENIPQGGKKQTAAAKPTEVATTATATENLEQSPMKRGKKASSKARRAKSWTSHARDVNLPSTGGTWFADMLPVEPATKSELVAEMAKRVGFEMDREQLKKMKARLDFFLTRGAATGALKTSGEGRERVFSRR